MLISNQHRGESLTIEARGTLRQTVGEGAKVLLQVKYGLIRLINVEADLCDQITNVDLHCPLKEGEITFQKKVDIPREIPPVCSPLPIILTICQANGWNPFQGKYAATADAYTKDNQKITCIQAEGIEF